MVPTVFLEASPVAQKNLHALFICRDALTSALTHVSSFYKAVVDSAKKAHTKKITKLAIKSYTTFLNTDRPEGSDEL
jgi:hypothetical protein